MKCPSCQTDWPSSIEPFPLPAFGPILLTRIVLLVSRCLRKDPERRIQHMIDITLALGDLKEEADSERWFIY